MAATVVASAAIVTWTVVAATAPPSAIERNGRTPVVWSAPAIIRAVVRIGVNRSRRRSRSGALVIGVRTAILIRRSIILIRLHVAERLVAIDRRDRYRCLQFEGQNLLGIKNAGMIARDEYAEQPGESAGTRANRGTLTATGNRTDHGAGTGGSGNRTSLLTAWRISTPHAHKLCIDV